MLDAISIVRNRQQYDTGKEHFLPYSEMKRERFRIDF
jgi:hypothetical protein